MNNIIPPLSSPIVEFRNLWKSFDKERIQVLRGASLRVSQGESVALVGASGSGKSSLLHLIAGLDEPDQGAVYVNGEPLGSGRRLTQRLRHQIGFVFQLHNLIPNLTLRENCMIPSVAAGVKKKTADARLLYLANATGITDRLDHRIQDLSGGERQRTALCRALMNSPQIILADEPTGSLDDLNRVRVFELLLELVRKEGITLIMATHDLELGRRCDRFLRVQRGVLFDETKEQQHLGQDDLRAI